MTLVLKDANLANALGFIAAHAVATVDLLEKRAYGTSGVKGVWKFKKQSIVRDSALVGFRDRCVSHCAEGGGMGADTPHAEAGVNEAAAPVAAASSL